QGLDKSRAAVYFNIERFEVEAVMGTHYRGTKDEVRALNAFIKLVRAADSVGARLKDSPAEAGLTDGQFGALEALYHLGPLHQRERAARPLGGGGTVPMVVDTLERCGGVRRGRGAEARRFVTVPLTDAGRRLIARLFPRHAARVTAEMSVLTPA